MGFWGKAGYSVGNKTMKGAEDRMNNSAGQNFVPGSSGYNVGKFVGTKFGVNPETGRSFTQVSKLGDFVPGGYENAFSNMANQQMDSMKRGLAGGARNIASSFGRSGLGLGAAAGQLMGQNAAMSRGASEIARNTGMDKLNYGTDMYKYDRNQGLAEEIGLGNLGLGRADSSRNDYLANVQGIGQQYNMDAGKNQQLFDQLSTNYNNLSQNKFQGTSGWGPQLGKYLGKKITSPKIGLPGGFSIGG